MIEIVPHSESWSHEFQQIAARLREVLGPLALRIDHIGSTSVPGLAAKPIIDIQVTVANFDSPQTLIDRIRSLGYEWRPNATDHRPPLHTGPESDWEKLFFRGPANQIRTNLHIRVEGRANQRYALLFRDYLRAHPAAAEAYATVKRKLAEYHPDSIETYSDIKDPVCDLIVISAQAWVPDWIPAPSDA